MTYEQNKRKKKSHVRLIQKGVWIWWSIGRSSAIHKMGKLAKSNWKISSEKRLVSHVILEIESWNSISSEKEIEKFQLYFFSQVSDKTSWRASFRSLENQWWPHTHIHKCMRISLMNNQMSRWTSGSIRFSFSWLHSLFTYTNLWRTDNCLEKWNSFTITQSTMIIIWMKDKKNNLSNVVLFLQRSRWRMIFVWMIW